MIILSCLLFLSFEGYLQFRYEIFGTRYGLAIIIPSLIFSVIAYLFDSRSVLCLAITSFAAWLGVTLDSESLFSFEIFDSSLLIYKSILYGATLYLIGYVLHQKQIKKHFCFTYFNFAIHLLCGGTLAGMIALDLPVVYFFLLAFICYSFIKYAIKNTSLYFLLISVLYGYIGITYLIFLWEPLQDVYIGLFYFIISCSGVIWFFRNYKNILNVKNESI
jgi:hypothetical protein